MIRESSYQLPQAEQEIPGFTEMAGHLFRFVQDRTAMVRGYVQRIDQPYLLKTLEKGLEQELAAQEDLEKSLQELLEKGVVDDSTHWQLEHAQTELIERKEFIGVLKERRNALLEKQ